MDNSLIVRHATVPVNAKPNNEYTPFDNIDFTLDFNGRAVLMNSIKLSGRVATTSGGEDDIFIYDETIGAHTFFDTITASTENQGIIETIQEYPRYVGMKSDATLNVSDMGGNLSNVIEMKTFNKQIVASNIGFGEASAPTGEDGGEITDPLSFVITPDIVFNNAQGATDASDVRVSYTKTGSLKLSLRVARVQDAFLSQIPDNNRQFALVDVKCHFLTVPDDNPKNQVVTQVKAHVKQTILSRQSNLSVRVPMVATSFSGSFLPINEVGTGAFNTHERRAINDMTNLQYLFNNNTMELITYELNDRGEILRHYLNSMGSGKKSQVAPYINSGRLGYGIGLEFQPTDLTSNSFNVNLEALTFQNNPHVLYGYFKGILAL
jgi:hypothetical protein